MLPKMLTAAVHARLTVLVAVCMQTACATMGETEYCGQIGTAATVCAYNIFVGAREPARREALSRWLRHNVFAGESVGVVGLTECNGWDQAFAEEFALASGARHGILMPCPTGEHDQDF